ncbi:hypothetical protein AC249_AIPGENE20249 [Exaiptasia diaphana]|nr:hypothetical protein AC249_AIPGENE20249 [Exaiptasia diaphana]
MGDEGGDRDMVEEQFNIWAVFKTIGSQFLQIDAIMPVIEKFVKGAGHSGFGNSDMKSAQFRSDCENALFFHPRLKESFHATMNDFTSFAMANGYALGAILMSNREKCRECKKKLYLDGKPKVVVIYHANFGTRLGSRYTKKCTGCHISEHYGYWTKHDKKHIDLDSGQKEYIMSTEETAIDVKLLEQYASLLIVGALPFTTFVNAYNRMYSTDISQAIDSFTSSPSKRRKRDSPADLTDLIQKRRRLDRRRFEDAFFLYASIRVRTKYSIPMEYTPYDTNEMLKMLCVSYYDAFVKKWGDHCCDTPGCEEIIVLDGNMKNARQVCCCNKIGYVQFSGLQEKVVTGCPNTPMQRHRYCSTHLGFAMPFRNDDVVPSALNQEQDNPLILSIISQKTTRQGRLLELLWSDNRKSWVRENNLPEEIKKLLEHNENLEHVTVSVTEIGQTRTEFRRKTKDEVTSSLNLSSNDIVDAKRLKYFIGQEDAHDLKDELYALKCGTEKGKHTAKHTKTAASSRLVEVTGDKEEVTANTSLSSNQPAEEFIQQKTHAR